MYFRILECIGGYLEGIGGYWRILGGIGGCWNVFQGIRVYWRVFGRYWRLLEGIGGYWRRLGAFIVTKEEDSNLLSSKEVTMTTEPQRTSRHLSTEH